MSGIQIDVVRTGFPVKIGELEFWFDGTSESVARFLDVKEELSKKEREISAKIKEYEKYDETNMTSEIAGKILDLQKENVSAHYDAFFGEGSFNQIYEKYPDINQLEDLIPVIDTAISQSILEHQEKRTEFVENKKQEYLNKKSRKK